MLGIGNLLGITGCYSVRTGNNSNVKRYEIRDMNGMVVGSYSVRTSSKSSSYQKPKKLFYNFKRISSQILKSKNSSGARKAASAARRQVAQLRRRVKTGEYDDRELEIAITHAEKMLRVAKKRVKHFQEEERAKKGGVCECQLDEKEKDKADVEELLEEENQSASAEQTDSAEEMRKIIEEAMREMEISMEEMKRAMEENMDELMESVSEMLEDTELDELAEELAGGVKPDMDPKDLEELKKKHRREEMKEIAEADAKYLKAMFEKWQSDKENVASNIAFANNNMSGSGVTLELGGVEMPAQETVSAAELVEGGAVDMSV